MKMIAVSRLSAKPIRDRNGQSYITPPAGWGFLHQIKLLEDTETFD